MKILITESKYKLLIRRLDDFAMIDREFKYRLRKESPRGWDDAQNYFSWVAYKTEDTVVYKLAENGLLKSKPEDELEILGKIRSEIAEYLYSNFYEYTEIYYRRYKESNFPK
jgi:hypothetical protein